MDKVTRPSTPKETEEVLGSLPIGEVESLLQRGNIEIPEVVKAKTKIKLTGTQLDGAIIADLHADGWKTDGFTMNTVINATNDPDYPPAGQYITMHFTREWP